MANTQARAAEVTPLKPGHDAPVTHENIAAALAAAQAEMGPAVKGATNPAFRTKYADLASVMDACLPALNRHAIAVVQPLVRDETGLSVVTRFIHVGGETLECPIPLMFGKQDMQGLGSAITYARRYGLMALAGVAPEDDDGQAAAESSRREREHARNDRPRQEDQAREAAVIAQAEIDAAVTSLEGAGTLDELKRAWSALAGPMQKVAAVLAAKDKRKAFLDDVPPPITDDEIPY